MHNEGYSTMCGHGIIALTTALLETGQLPRTGPVTEIGYDTPAGFIRARAEINGDQVRRVTFQNVPSFVHTAGLRITVDGTPVMVDIVFGGAFYALVEATALAPDLAVRPEHVTELIARGMAVKHAVEATAEIVHPTEPELRGIYGTIITGPAEGEGARHRNVTVFAAGEVDRSPCGTGTAATTAAFVARGTLPLGEEWVNESIIGTHFTGRAIAQTEVGDYPAVIPEIGGRGFITGYHTFVLDPDDEAGRGFLVR
jgi:proline racemase